MFFGCASLGGDDDGGGGGGETMEREVLGVGRWVLGFSQCVTVRRSSREVIFVLYLYYICTISLLLPV